MCNIRYVNYFDDYNINIKLKEVTEKLYTNKNFESVILLNNKTYEYIGPESQNMRDTVNFSDTMIEKLNSCNDTDSFTIIHNHPFGNTFSIMDIVEFFKYPKLKMMIAVSDDCNEYYALLKENVNDIILYNAAIKIYNRFICKGYGHKPFIPLLKTMEKNGIKYNEFIFN